MNLEDLKKKKPPELLAFAEEQGVEGAAQMRRQELLFAILQKLATNDEVISGSGTIEVIPDGFGYLRSMEANYLPGADDIYVSPQQVRSFGLRTGFIHRPKEYGPGRQADSAKPGDFDVVAEDMVDLAGKMGA